MTTPQTDLSCVKFQHGNLAAYDRFMLDRVACLLRPGGSQMSLYAGDLAGPLGANNPALANQTRWRYPTILHRAHVTAVQHTFITVAVKFCQPDVWNDPMKTCALCRKRLGLGVRYRWVWRKFWFNTTSFCGCRCERLYIQRTRSLRFQLSQRFATARKN